MRKIAVAFLLLASSFAFSQSEKISAERVSNDPPPKIADEYGVLTKGHSEWGVYTGIAQGFGKRSGTHVFMIGGRYGHVFTGDHGPGWLRGNFEVRTDFLPFVAVWQAGKDAYGGEFRPLTLVWNFKGNKTVKPFFELGGGLLVTSHDVPQNTNNVNFTPQGGPGFHFYTNDGHHAWTLQTKYQHISNAGLDRKNSGVNAALQLTIGYTWFK